MRIYKTIFDTDDYYYFIGFVLESEGRLIGKETMFTYDDKKMIAKYYFAKDMNFSSEITRLVNRENSINRNFYWL